MDLYGLGPGLGLGYTGPGWAGLGFGEPVANTGSGPAEQRSSLNRDVWDALISLAGADHRRIRLQWVPSHCGLRGNEKADALAKAASVSRRRRFRWIPGPFTEQLPGGRVPETPDSDLRDGTAT